MKNRLLSVILTTMAILMPTKLLAQEPYAVLSDGNTILTFYYDDQKTARGGMDVGPFNSYTFPLWYDQKDNITNVVFDISFADCTTLTSTAYWFNGLENLTSITGISNLKTDNVTDMNSMFSFCSSLSAIDVSGFNTENVTGMGRMFYGCSSLTSLDVSGFNTENVTYMYEMFNGCSGLTSLDVSGFNTENVTSMDGMFNGCSDLTTLDVSNFNTANVTNISWMFSRCSDLTSLDVSNFNTANVTDMGGMFSDCSSLTSLDLSSFNTDNVADMNAMFSDCSSLTSLDLSSFNTENVTYMSYMFSSCSGLTSLDLSGFNTENVTNMRNMFWNCSGLTSLDLSGFNTENVTEMVYIFCDCSGLTSLDISGFNTANVTNMASMFSGCSDLTNLDISNFNTANVTDMSWMFRGCSGLLSLDLRSFNTANVTDTEYIFADCSSLAAIQAGNANIPAEQYAQIGNPNLLVYVNEASLAPQGIQNVVIDGVAQEIILRDTIAGNNNWYCPQPFTAQKISYTRNFQQQTQIGVSRGWETIALPFNVQTITHETRGEISPFGNYQSSYHFWLRRLTQNGLQSVPEINANVAYVISMPNSSEYPAEYNLAGKVTFSAENAPIPETYPEMVETDDIAMAPAFQRIEVDEHIYALNVGEPRGNHPEGSVFEKNYREVRPFEAFTKHFNENGARFLSIEDMLNGGVTGIEELKNGKMEGLKSESWYDLNGRRVLNPSKGVYIHNGKQIIVK